MGRGGQNEQRSGKSSGNKSKATEMNRKEKTINHQGEMNEAKADQTTQQHCNCSCICFAWSSGGIILKYEDKSERNREKEKKKRKKRRQGI
jgi:hypothetical protein